MPVAISLHGPLPPTLFCHPAPPPQPNVTVEELDRICAELATTEGPSRFNGTCITDEVRTSGRQPASTARPACEHSTHSVPLDCPLLPARSPSRSTRPVRRSTPTRRPTWSGPSRALPLRASELAMWGWRRAA